MSNLTFPAMNDNILFMTKWNIKLECINIYNFSEEKRSDFTH